MNTVLGVMFIHTASVETLSGATPTGQEYAAPVDVAGFLDDANVLVASPGGTQLVAKTTFYAAPEAAPLFEPGSRVTCNGRVMEVQSVKRRDASGPLAPAAHVEVDLS